MPPDPRIRVGFELTVCELDAGGTARTARSLLEALAACEQLEALPIAHPGRRRNRVVRGLARELTWLPVRLPRAARRLRIDLLHCPGPVAPLRSPAPLVVGIPDALPWRHPEWLTRANVASHRLVVRRAAMRAAAVITVSEHARQEIQETYGVAPERLHVVPHGLDPQFTPAAADEKRLAALRVHRPYVLTVGTLQPRKNVGVLLEAFERLVALGMDLRLVVAGGAGWGERVLSDRLARSPARSRVQLVGAVGEDELVAPYRAAECFVFPSRY